MTKISRMFALVIMLLAISTVGHAGDILSINSKQVIKIDGEVDSRILRSAKHIDKWSAKSKDPIFIIINSNGGNVTSGLIFLDSMTMAQSRGVELVCAVTHMAASMAFTILAKCDTRFSLNYSLLLFHPMKIGSGYGAFSADEMEYLVKMLRAWELPLNDLVINALNIDKELFYYHYAHETLFIPDQLLKISPDFIRKVNDIKGIGPLY